MKRPILLLALCALALSGRAARAQEYRNVVNTRFNTISNGPMQAIIVDVPNAQDDPAVTRAILTRVQAVRQARKQALQLQLARLRGLNRGKHRLTPLVPDIVYVRENARLVVPTGRAIGRAPGLAFHFPLSAAAGDMGWTAAQATELNNIANVMYNALTIVYGQPSWSGTVDVLDADNAATPQGDPDALSGGVYVVSQHKILFAEYNHIQSRVLGLTQMMAIAFHGPASISYDAWERGMARAATLEAVRSALGALNQPPFAANSVDPSDGLWQVMDLYDLNNQPPLANDRFYPVSRANGVQNQPSFPLMLFDRLRMSGTAWLKVAAESPGFFAAFNAAYYQAFAADQTIKNNVPALKNLAQQAAAQVEGLAFSDWYDRQYVLDTSVAPGVKLYGEVFGFTRPSGSQDSFGATIVLKYYRTSFDASGNSAEVSLNATCFPIYWDDTYANRLFLAAQYERVDIVDGQGTDAPVFFNTISSTAPGGQIRVTIDFPVNAENVRLYLAPRSTGLNAPPISYFYGAVVGADTGTMKIDTDTGTHKTFPVSHGAFGGQIDDAAFSRPTRATLTFLDPSNNPVGTRHVNVGYAYNGDPAQRIQEYAAVFYVSDPVTSLMHTFPQGPALISFPIQPLLPRAEDALLDPTTGKPLFGHTNLLLAQWRQSLNNGNGDNYERYPSLDPLQPGKGYWEMFGADTPIMINGKVTTPDQDVSTGLLFGWNQIGPPYQQSVSLAGLRFQHVADNTNILDIPGAVAQGWIASQDFPVSPTNTVKVSVWDYAPSTGYLPANALDPWKGYWIRVLVTEGLAITYPNPTAGGRAVRRPTRAAPTGKTAKPPTGWAIPFTVNDGAGHGATVYLGQSDQAEAGANLKMNAPLPPPISRALPWMAFHHPEWGASAGDYFSEIHRTGARDPWEITVIAPDPTRSYTLRWSNLSGVPRGTRLVLVDAATGKRQYLQTSSGYTFVPGNASTRTFQIVPEVRTGSSLRVLNLLVRPTRAAGASTFEIHYDLTQGADVSAEIRAVNGRLIRQLAAGRAATTGTNSVVWDLRDQRGVSVPAGVYLLNITARTPEGESARAIQTFTIVR